MRIDLITYEEFRNIVFQFKYFPIPPQISIFLTDELAGRILTTIIKDLVEDVHLVATKDYFECTSKTGGVIRIFIYKNKVRPQLGGRAHIVIGDTEYSLKDFQEILAPMANLGPTWQVNFISSQDIIKFWTTEHIKGMEGIKYWEKAGPEYWEEIINKKENYNDN